MAVARHLGAPVNYIHSPPRHPGHEEAFRAINPNMHVPVLVEDDGRTLWEADAIACRLSALAGSDFWRTGASMPEMVMWVSWSTHHLNHAAGTLYFDRVVRPTFSDRGEDPAVLDRASRDFRRWAEILDAQLAGRDWLVDGRLSYADFRVASALSFAEAARLPLDGQTHLKRWHDQFWAIEAWRAPFAALD